jgi:redox-sensitive bicupin YhaK (pirin superfamily)
MNDAILQVTPLGPSPTPWPCIDPFLFCVHHHDAYPRGNGRFGPDAPLKGRNIGQDFAGRDGWNMYHGEQIPGFPAHPHRGFETVTIVRQGLIDHADSLGAAARFGAGDVQWLTAGQGVVHAEMFPLLHTEQANPLELFQIWLNLPARRKMAPPHFTMLWSDQIPDVTHHDAEGRATTVRYAAGQLSTGDARPPAPPPDSWAAEPDADLVIATLRMAPHARWTLPAAAAATTQRMLYTVTPSALSVAGRSMAQRVAIQLRGDAAVELVNGDQSADLLLLQARPIGEPVAQYGPFVMNTRAEIQQAFEDYQRTGFGGWPWGDSAPVHAQAEGRFARHADGRVEQRPQDGRPPVA